MMSVESPLCNVLRLNAFMAGFLCLGINADWFSWLFYSNLEIQEKINEYEL